MSTAKLFRVACLALGLALLGAAAPGRSRTPAANGVRGGTLRVLTADTDINGWTRPQLLPQRRDRARLRPDPVRLQPLRGTRAGDRPGPRHRQRPPSSRPTGAPTPSPCAPGSATPPRSTARSPPTTSSPPSSGSTTRRAPAGGQEFADLIAGASRFGAGKASRISGLAAPDARTLTITLDQPAGDFLSILTLPFFAPVPGEYAASYAVGANYDGHVVGSGPYTPTTYIPGKTVVLVPQPQLGSRHRPVAQGLGGPDPGQARRQHRVDPAGHRAGGGRPVAEQPRAPGAGRRTPGRSGAIRAAVGQHDARMPAASSSLGPTGGPARSPTSGSAKRSTTPSTRSPTATPSPGGSPPPASWPPPSWHRVRSATATTTSTRPRAAGATPPRPKPCWPRPATPTG